jgi:hypothetical protein
MGHRGESGRKAIRSHFLQLASHGSTHDGKLAPAGVIQIQEVLPVEYSSPIKRPRGGSAAGEQAGSHADLSDAVVVGSIQTLHAARTWKVAGRALQNAHHR